MAEEQPVIDPNAPGPGGTPTPAPTLVEVEIGGVKMKVAEDVASAITKQKEESQGAVEEAEARAADATRAAAIPAPQPKEGEKRDPFAYLGDQLFEDPAAALRGFAQLMKQNITSDLTGKYQAASNEKEFWADFYETNPDLKEFKLQVDGVTDKNMSKIGSLPVDKAVDRIADLTRKELLRISNKFGKGKQEPNKSTTLESAQDAVLPGPGGAPQEGNPMEPAEQGKVVTLSSLLKDRKERRRKAASQKVASG